MQIKQKLVAGATTAAMAISLFAPVMVLHAQGFQADKNSTNPFQKGGGYVKESAKSAGLGEQTKTLPEIIGSIINIALSLLGLIFLGLALYAGFKWMTAQGDSKEVDAAKDTLKNSVIGLIVIMASYALSNFVISQFYNATQ